MTSLPAPLESCPAPVNTSPVGVKQKHKFGRRQHLIWGGALSVGAALIVTLLFFAGFFQRLEWITFDQRAAWYRAGKQAHPDIAVILIDEASLKALDPLVGRWPWPRKVYADLISFLVTGEARAVVFDILFTENEARGRQITASDRLLINATRDSGIVHHAFQIVVDKPDEVDPKMLNLKMPADFRQRFGIETARGFTSSRYNNFYIPRTELYRAARGMGIVEFDGDADGVYRRTRLYREYQGAVYPGLSVSPLLELAGGHDAELRGKRLKFADFDVPVANDGTFLINLYGQFNAYSMSGVLSSAFKLARGEVDKLLVSPEEFRNKIVFVSGSAPGMGDIKTTSVSKGMPGVLLHASVTSNILAKDFLTVVPWGVNVLFIFLLAIGTGLSILFIPRLWQKITVPLGLALVYVGWVLFQFRLNIVYEMVAPLASAFATWLGTFGLLAFTEGRDKRRVRTMLAQYVSPNILSTVVDKYEDYLRAEVGSKERITLLFSDIRGFTSLSESLAPEEVVEILNVHFAAMSEAIFQYEGTLDKFIGDALMAFWGAPIRVADHARRGVLAAFEMQRRLEGVNQELATRGRAPVHMGIGLNTGEVILGNVGSEKKLDYTAIGDNVNLASRVEGLTKQYDCPIMITESTYKEIAGEIPCGLVDQVRVKGKHLPVRLYRPLAPPDAPPEVLVRARDQAALHEQAFTAYLERRWNDAAGLYAQLPEDRVQALFLARCRDYTAQPPAADWDGVYTATKK
jgi:adenylate cyclase